MSSSSRGRFGGVEREPWAPRAAGVAGLVFSALFSVSLALLYRQPAKGSTADEITVWYLRDEAKTLGLVGLYLAPFAGSPIRRPHP